MGSQLMLLGWLSSTLLWQMLDWHLSQMDLDLDPEAFELIMRAQEIPFCKWAEAEDPCYSS